MAVTLDAPASFPPHAGSGPIWRVVCDGCRDRLYLAGFTAEVAIGRAEREHGWRHERDRIRCRRCRRG